MSDSESIIAVPPHPTLGGKSLEAIQRPRYKSWRKKYRKLRVRFDHVLDDNKRLFKEEYKLQAIAKRLREELDGLLELCLDLNENPSIPPEMRFNVKLPRHVLKQNVVPEGITPEASNALLADYRKLVNEGRIPPLDLHVIREQIDERLAVQEVRDVNELDSNVPHPAPTEPMSPTGVEGERLVGFLTTEEEDAFLLKQYAQLGDQWSMDRTAEHKDNADDKNLADLTPRELERQIELLNPQSQHNWIRNHNKSQPIVDDNDSLASHDTKPSRKRGGKNLAKQVGDRAVERAREGLSPGAASVYDDDELGFIDEYPGASGKKRIRDPDTTYRVKGGKSSGTTNKAKRKRNSGDELGGGNGNSAKKPRVETGPE